MIQQFIWLVAMCVQGQACGPGKLEKRYSNYITETTSGAAIMRMEYTKANEYTVLYYDLFKINMSTNPWIAWKGTK